MNDKDVALSSEGASLWEEASKPETDLGKPKSYKPRKLPMPYVCTECGAEKCKLWRDYNTMACYTDLLCAICACESQDKSLADIGDDGKIRSEYFNSVIRTDQIGWMVPAVPVDDTFWGYTSVPPEGVAWWKELPTFRENAVKTLWGWMSC